MSDEEEFEIPSPHDLAAERVVLGAMMMSASVADEMAARLCTADFYRPAHQHVYEAICALAKDGEPTEPTAVSGQLTKTGKLATIGGLPGLFDLYQSAPVAQNASHYAERILAHSTRRGIESAGHRFVQLSRNTELSVEELVATAASVLEENTARSAVEAPDTLASSLPEWLDRLEDKTPDKVIPTGFTDLDDLFAGGLRPGQLVFAAGRPGMGKSVFMLGLAQYIGVVLRRPVVFASLEMSRQELIDRIVSSYAKVSLSAIRDKGNLDDSDWERIAKTLGALSEADTFVLDDQPGTGLTRIRARLRAMQRAGNPCELLVVDYLQLMTSEGRAESRQLEISGLSRSLKLLAKEFAIPVVVGSQLNREVERRNDKTPGLSDLRESGSLEQDADIVILLHREDAYDKETPRAGEADFIVAKHRNGPTATITVAFQGHYSRFVDMAAPPFPHPQSAGR